MNIDIQHAKNFLMGWDINVRVSADNSEQISYVETKINGFPEAKEFIDPPVRNYTKKLLRQGQYPGDKRCA